MIRSGTCLLMAAGLMVLAGCGEAQPDVEEEHVMEDMDMPMASEMAAEPASVWFAEPQDGATVTGPDIRVVLEVSGLEVVEAGVFEERTGHHHIFLNEDVTPHGEVIPAGIPGIIHLGLAQTEHVIEGVEPGEHRLIAVVGDGAHISLDPPVVDTIHITVVPPSQ